MPKRQKQDEHVLDPATFDLDAWLEEGPQTQVVYLYPNDHDYARRLADLEQQARRAERIQPEDRSIDDPSVEQVAMLVDELKADRERTAIPIELRALRDAETVAVGLKAKKAKADKHEIEFWILAEAIQDERWTVERLRKLATRDAVGEDLLKQLIAAYNELKAGPSAPFSPAS